MTTNTILTNNTLRINDSELLVGFRARGKYISVASFNQSAGGNGEVATKLFEATQEETAPNIVGTLAYVIQNALGSSYNSVYFLVPEQVAIRVFEIRKYMNEGMNADEVLQAVSKEWFTEAWESSVHDLVQAMFACAESNKRIGFMKSHNVNLLELNVGDSADVLEEGMILEFKDGSCGDVKCIDAEMLNGQRKIVVRNFGNTKRYYVEREFSENNVVMNNAKKLLEIAGEALPKPKALDATVIKTDSLF